MSYINCQNLKLLLFLLVIVPTFLKHNVQCCPLQTDSPCHCGIRNDSTSYIQCHQKSLLEIPKFMHSFSYDQLILSDNFISTIDEHSFENVRVRQIFFTGNPLSNISANAFGQQSVLHHLEEIYIDFLKNVKAIPHSLLCRAGKLKVLNIEGLNLGSGVNLIACKNMTRLQTLVLADCGIGNNFRMKNFHNLKELDLSRNQLSIQWPLSNDQLPINLKSLNLSSNRLTTMTTEMPLSLVTIDLSSNQLAEWPTASFCKSKNLRNIYLNLNQLSTLPHSIETGCSRLKLNKLSLRSNRFASFTLDNKLKESIFEQIAILDLSWNQIESFDTLSFTNNIEELFLAGNKLEKVPLNIPISMRILDLSFNKICSISSSSVKLLSRLKIYSLDENPFFCDCNLRALQQDLQRREKNIHGNNIKCTLPKQLRDVFLNDATLQCFINVPNCVKQIHGPHLLQPSKSDVSDDNYVRKPIAGITDVFVRYLHNTQKTILVVWDWVNYLGEDIRDDYVFRVSFEPHLKSKLYDTNEEEQANTIQISSQLPSTARRFALQNAMPDHVYTVCVISNIMKHERSASPSNSFISNYNRRRCTDIYTGNGDTSYDYELEENNESRNFIYTSKSNKPDEFDTGLLTILVIIIVVITVALSFVLIILVILIVRRRHDLQKWQKLNRNHLLSSLESGSSHPFVYNTSECCHQHYKSEPMRTPDSTNNDVQRLSSHYYCSYCCCCRRKPTTSDNVLNTTSAQLTIDNSKQDLPGTIHLYHEINDNFANKVSAHI